MMFVHSTSSGSQTAASELYKAGPLVATCALCSEASPVTEQEAVEIFSYPCHHPYICPCAAACLKQRKRQTARWLQRPPASKNTIARPT